MSIQAHLAELERKHQALEQELADAMAHPSVDDMTIAELKRRKLQVKDEIARLKQDSNTSVHAHDQQKWAPVLGPILRRRPQ
jgi:hypothetical protein